MEVENRMVFQPTHDECCHGLCPRFTDGVTKVPNPIMSRIVNNLNSPPRRAFGDEGGPVCAVLSTSYSPGNYGFPQFPLRADDNWAIRYRQSMSLSGMVEIPRPLDPAQDRLQSERRLVMPARAGIHLGLRGKAEEILDPGPGSSPGPAVPRHHEMKYRLSVNSFRTPRH